jgi:hypothetical protein
MKILNLAACSALFLFAQGAVALAADPAAPHVAAPAPPPAKPVVPPVAAEKPATVPDVVAPPTVAGAPNWKDMKKDDRKKYMKKVVLPKAKDAFFAFDPKHYPKAKVTCATCHGDGASDGSFKMPNEKLPKLPNDMAGFKALNEKKPAVMEFMGKKVKPMMASLLGMPEFNMQTKQGFGCNGCHTSEPAAK